MSTSPTVILASPQPLLQAPRQISMTFDSNELRGMSAQQRATALTNLANLLFLAAGGAPKEDDDEQS